MEFPTKPKEPLTADPRLLIIYSKPKQGKTTAFSLLPNNLIIDMEEGSDHVGGLIIKANTFNELRNVIAEMRKQKIQYDYITLDTTTVLEEFSAEFGKELYQATPMGANWGKIDPKTKKVKAGQDNILKLPNGAGYLYVREAFQKIINGFRPFAKKCLILSGHVKDKLIEKDGEEIEELQIDLAGKLARIIPSKADAIGLAYREDNQMIVNFDGGDESVIEARPAHLSGQKIVLTEKGKDGKITAYWDRIFTELNK